MNNNQLRYAILTGLFIIPFVPLLVSNSLFFPFITGKAFFFRFIVQIIFALYVILAIRDSEYRPKSSWILRSLVIFMVCIGVADLFAINPIKAFWSNFERMEGYIALVHFAMYFVVLSSVIKTQDLWNKLLSTSVFASFIMSIYSLLQISGKININQGGVRVDGTLGNAAYLGIYMVFHIFFAALLFGRSRATWQKILLSSVIILNTIVLYFTATRGAILGIIGGSVVSLLYLLLKSEKGEAIRKYSLIGITTLLILVGVFFVSRNTDFVKNSPVLSRFSSLSISEIKNQGRYYVWPMAWKGFIENPVLGWGQEGFNFVFNKNYDPRMYNQEPWFDRAHNTYLDWLIAGGLLGLVSYLMILMSTIYYLFKSDDSSFKKLDKAVLLGLVSGYAFNNIFVFDQTSSYILFFTVIAYVHSHSVSKENGLFDKIKNKIKNILDNEESRPVLESIVVILLLISIYVFSYIPWNRNSSLLKILAAQSSGKVLSTSEYTKILNSSGLGFPEIVEHMSQVVVGISSNTNVDTLTKQTLFSEMDKAFKRQIEDAPTDIRYLIFYSGFLSQFGMYDSSLEQLIKAKNISPNKQDIYFEIINTLFSLNRKQDALSYAEQSYNINPSNKKASLVYAYVLEQNGRSEDALNLINKIPEAELVFDDVYINILATKKDWNSVINIAKRRIELEPNVSRHNITLVAAYIQANRRDEAISVLESMIIKDPSFKQQGEYYISQIKAGNNP